MSTILKSPLPSSVSGTALLVLAVASGFSALMAGEPRPPQRLAPRLAGPGIVPEQDASTTTVPSNSFFSYEKLARHAQQVQLLPGQRGFVFTIYNAPGELHKVQQLVRVMREQMLGNGFDPGPSPNARTKPIFDELATAGWPVLFYSGAEMQIQGGRAVMGGEQRGAISAMDDAGIFTAYQLGEWGYYFHVLSTSPRWWREVYGKEFDTFEHLMKPAGLAGYDRRPTRRKECYDIVKDYFQSRAATCSAA